MDDNDAAVIDGFLEEATDTTHMVVHHAADTGVPRTVVFMTCYTTGFEAGLALGLHSPTLGWRMLTAIDRVMLEGSEQAIVTERTAYLERYRDVIRKGIE